MEKARAAEEQSKVEAERRRNLELKLREEERDRREMERMEEKAVKDVEQAKQREEAKQRQNEIRKRFESASQTPEVVRKISGTTKTPPRFAASDALKLQMQQNEENQKKLLERSKNLTSRVAESRSTTRGEGSPVVASRVVESKPIVFKSRLAQQPTTGIQTGFENNYF